jgi:hypothetical protein
MTAVALWSHRLSNIGEWIKIYFHSTVVIKFF